MIREKKGRNHPKKNQNSKNQRNKSQEKRLVRLQKYLAECGIASRRNSEALIEEGRIKVNGSVVTTIGTKIDPKRDSVRVGNKIVKPPEKGILLFNKPKGVVSTLDDPQGRRCIADYLTKHYTSYFPVGRLDWESTGLIILTNDGELADTLMHPRYEVPRVYHARVEGKISNRVIENLSRGVKLTDGKAKAEASILSADDKSSWVEVTVLEGRNRLVRRLFDAVGHPVMKLNRVSHGPVRLGKLKPGDIRRLTTEEYRTLKSRIERYKPS